MKIAFHSNQLGIRGTEVTMYDYAFYNRGLLGNDSIIIAPANGDMSAKEKFENQFNVLLYDNLDEITEICRGENVDAFWAIKGGENDGVVSHSCKNLIQCVFRCDDPHGDVYSVQSDYLNNKFKTAHPVVPCIVSLPNISDNLRDILNIPKSALVIGRHGAKETWFDGKGDYDLGASAWVTDTLEKALEIRKDLWLVFMNTPEFTDHPRAIFLPEIIDLEMKTRFINTCDAMIHSREDGETFGLAIAEFSIKNKPIITNPEHCHDRAHIKFLHNNFLSYKHPQTLMTILLEINRQWIYSRNWDVFSDFTNPDFVMQQFKKHYLEDLS